MEMEREREILEGGREEREADTHHTAQWLRNAKETINCSARGPREGGREGRKERGGEQEKERITERERARVMKKGGGGEEVRQSQRKRERSQRPFSTVVPGLQKG